MNRRPNQPHSAPATILVLGVGNPYRRDDGFGVDVVSRLEDLNLDHVEVQEESGEPGDLVCRWTGRDTVVLVDAINADAPPGTVHRMEFVEGAWDVPVPKTRLSTHGLGIAEGVELGEILGRLPRRLVVLGVEAADTSSGVGLSPEVERAAGAVVEEIENLRKEVLGNV